MAYRYRRGSGAHHRLLLPTLTNPQAEIHRHLLHRRLCHPYDLRHPQDLFLDNQWLCHQLALPSHVRHHHSSTPDLIQAMLLNECIEMSPRPKDLGEEERFWRWNTFDQYSTHTLMRSQISPHVHGRSGGCYLHEQNHLDPILWHSFRFC